MQSHLLQPTRWALVVLAAIALSACTMDKTKAPALAGPSGFALSLSMTATPDVVARDGASQSMVWVSVRGADGKPASGQRVVLSVSPINAGTLSSGDVTTGSDGRVSVVYTAPNAAQPVDTATISATLSGDNADNAHGNRAVIALRGSAAPSPSFTYSPSAPKRFQNTLFDASATTLDGRACGTSCQYSWDFGGENTKTGQVVQYAFKQQGIYSVTLTVTGPDGVVVTSRQTVTVAAPDLPTPRFTFSPTNPLTTTTVYFNATTSTAANGATISRYTWDFGNGQSDTGSQVSTQYTGARTYTVTLTVEDSNGLTASTTQSLTVQ